MGLWHGYFGREVCRRQPIATSVAGGSDIVPASQQASRPGKAAFPTSCEREKLRRRGFRPFCRAATFITARTKFSPAAVLIFPASEDCGGHAIWQAQAKVFPPVRRQSGISALSGSEQAARSNRPAYDPDEETVPVPVWCCGCRRVPCRQPLNLNPAVGIPRIVPSR